MAENLPQFLVADKGVQLTASPLHTPEGGLLSAQNVEFIRVKGLGGIGSRGSLTRLNSATLAGAVHQLVNLPFPFPTEKVLMVGMNTGETETWKKSTDGTTYEDLLAAQLQRTLGVSKLSADLSAFINAQNIYMGQRAVSFKRRFYYAGDNYTVWFPTIADPSDASAPPLVVWDGTTSFELFRIPDNPTATAGSKTSWLPDMLAVNGTIYLTTWDPGGVAPSHKGRVIAFDPAVGTLALVGNRFGNGVGENTNGFPYCLANAFGSLWAGTMGLTGGSPGKVYRIHAAIDETWTLDHTIADNGAYPMSMLAFDGNLYVAVTGIAGLAAKIWQRTPGGTWSAHLTAGTTGVSYFGGLIEYEDLLFAAYHRSGAESGIWVWNGTAWSEEVDIDTAYSVTTHAPGTPFVFEGNLYWPWFEATTDNDTTGFLLKRTSAGAWSQVLTGVGVRGALGFYRPDAD